VTFLSADLVQDQPHSNRSAGTLVNVFGGCDTSEVELDLMWQLREAVI
jgi:hypothetical protein